MTQPTEDNKPTFPQRTIIWKGYEISVHRWGPIGMWGVDASNIAGKAFFGELERYSRQRAQGFRYWVATVAEFSPKFWPKSEYSYFKTLAELSKAHPNAIPFDGSGHRYSLAKAIRQTTNEAIISSSPIDPE